MEKESLKERLEKVRRSQDIAHANLFNNQNIKTDTYSDTEFNCRHTSVNLKYINDILVSEARVATFFFDYDHLNMGLLIGLIFNGKDLDENGHIKEGAVPEENMVRYYTGHVTTYLDGKLNEEPKSDKGSHGVHGVVNYEELIKGIEEEGLMFNGPRSFNELKKRILSGEKFDISLSVDLEKKKQGPVKKL